MQIGQDNSNGCIGERNPEGKQSSYFYSIGVLSLHSHLQNYHLREGELAGESDERPLRGKATIPKGKLNHPAVRVLDAENVILGKNPNLSPISKGTFAQCFCSQGCMVGGYWQYINGITPDYEPSFEKKKKNSVGLTAQDYVCPHNNNKNGII